MTHPSALPEHQRLESLQVLRAIAAFMVVAFHAQNPAFAIAGFDGPKPVWGAAGVDVFFIISGFVMIYITETRTTQAGKFAFDRFARIFPNYWLATALAVILSLLLPGLLNFPTEPGYAVNSALLIPDLRPGTADSYNPLVYPGWTLRFELMFYAVFALALLVRSHRILFISLGLMVTYWVMTIFPQVRLFEEMAKKDVLFLEFIMGMGLARLHLDRGAEIHAWVNRQFARSALQGTLLALILPGSFALIVLADWRLFGWLGDANRAFNWGLPALAFTTASLYLMPPLLRHLGGLRSLLVTMGDASYSVYLYHIFTLKMLMRSGVFDGLDGALGYWVYLSVLFVVTGAVSWLIYIGFERPAMAGLRRLYGGWQSARRRHQTGRAMPGGDIPVAAPAGAAVKEGLQAESRNAKSSSS